MRVLITTPDLSVRMGGVANYVRVSQRYYTCTPAFAVRGARSYDGSPRRGIGSFLRMVSDTLTLFAKMSPRSTRVVHQNTNFGRAGLVRDAAGVLLSLLLRKRLVVFFHGWDQDFERRMAGVSLALFRNLYLRADAICVLSRESERRLRAWGYRGRIHVETTMVDDELVDERPVPVRAPGEPFMVVFLSRIGREKGIFESIRAVHLLRSRGHDVRLLVAGEGADAAEARAMARASIPEACEFLGYAAGSDKVEVFRRGHAYVLPSDTEGMPTTVLEAMACGLPVVTRPVGGLVDFFEPGRMGYLVPEKSGAAFADALEMLLADENLRSEMGVFNARYARERFLASRVVGRLERLYSELGA